MFIVVCHKYFVYMSFILKLLKLISRVPVRPTNINRNYDMMLYEII